MLLSSSPLPNVGDDFAADAKLTSVAVSHNTLGRRDDSDAQAADDAGKVILAHEDAQAGLGNTTDAADNLGAALAVLEGDDKVVMGTT